MQTLVAPGWRASSPLFSDIRGIRRGRVVLHPALGGSGVLHAEQLAHEPERHVDSRGDPRRGHQLSVTHVAGAGRRGGTEEVEMLQLWNDAFMEMSDLLEEAYNQLPSQRSGVVALSRDLR